MTISHEFLVWSLETPVVCIGVIDEFDVWSPTNAPVEDIDETYEPDRRRVEIS